MPISDLYFVNKVYLLPKNPLQSVSLLKTPINLHLYNYNVIHYFILPHPQEIAQAMQGVDILVSCVSTSPWSQGFLAQSFFSCLISDNLLTQCKAVIVRVVPWKDQSKYSRQAKPSTVEEVLKRYGLDSSNLQEKLCKDTIHIFCFESRYIKYSWRAVQPYKWLLGICEIFNNDKYAIPNTELLSCSFTTVTC